MVPECLGVLLLGPGDLWGPEGLDLFLLGPGVLWGPEGPDVLLLGLGDPFLPGSEGLVLFLLWVLFLGGRGVAWWQRVCVAPGREEAPAEDSTAPLGKNIVLLVSAGGSDPGLVIEHVSLQIGQVGCSLNQDNTHCRWIG